MSEIKETKICAKCHRPLDKNANYYKRKDGVHVDQCKKCQTMHVNIQEPATILPLLEDLDIPFIEVEWKKLVDKYGNNPKTTSTAIFGRYVSVMKLKQYSKYNFVDTEKFMADEQSQKLRERAAKIAKINKYKDDKNSGLIPDDLQGLDLSVLSDKEQMEMIEFSQREQFNDINMELEMEESPLTAEDKYYLMKKWGRSYSIDECLGLERLFLDMMESYDIRTASHKDYLMKICRMSQKIDQSMEVNDIEGAQKMTRMYDLLMKSAKFTAAQIKDAGEDNVDSIGIIVSKAEELAGKDFIHTPVIENEDIVDRTIKDMNRYTEMLIKEEMNLGDMIEIYLQKLEIEQKDSKNFDSEEDILTAEELEDVLTDEDFAEFSEMVEDDMEIDEKLISELGGE